MWFHITLFRFARVSHVSYAFHSKRKLHPERLKDQLVNQVVLQWCLLNIYITKGFLDFYYIFLVQHEKILLLYLYSLWELKIVVALCLQLEKYYCYIHLLVFFLFFHKSKFFGTKRASFSCWIVPLPPEININLKLIRWRCCSGN